MRAHAAQALFVPRCVNWSTTGFRDCSERQEKRTALQHPGSLLDGGFRAIRTGNENGPALDYVGLKSLLPPITGMNRCAGSDLAMSLDRSMAPADKLAMQPTEITPAHLIHVNPEFNMVRFHRIDSQPTHFGEVETRTDQASNLSHPRRRQTCPKM